MDRTVLRRELLNMIECEWGGKLSSLDESADLRSDLNLDWLGMVGLALRIEQRFAVEITSTDIVNINKASELIDLIEAKADGNVPLTAALNPSRCMVTLEIQQRSLGLDVHPSLGR